jgi:putative phosphoesterase
VYLIGGDLFNSFTESLDYAKKLDEELGDEIILRYIVGNHDLNGVDYQTAESDVDELYLHNKFLDVEDIRIIGNNGWYDHGFVRGDYTEEDIEVWKQAYWYDRILDMGGLTDQQRMANVLDQVGSQLIKAQESKKKIVMITHFVPRFDYIHRFPSDPRWDKVNAMLGSPRMGELLDEEYVQLTIFGHLHIHPAPVKAGINTYFDQAIGYHTVNTDEWEYDNFMEEWMFRLRVVDL